MKKILYILVGLLLILVLAYVALQEVSAKIKNDLLVKATTKFVDKGIVDVQAEVRGEGLSLSRTLSLTGTVGSQSEKEKIAILMENLEGVSSVENSIEVKERQYTISKTVEVVPVKVLPVKKVLLQVVEEKTPIKHETISQATASPSTIKKEGNEVDEKLLTKKVALIPEVVSVKELSTEPKAVSQIIEVATVVESITIVPMAPVVKKNLVEVPVVIDTIKIPKPIQVIDVPVAIEIEKNKNIKIEGVK